MPFMITRNKDVNVSNEVKIITLCCEEVIEKQIIPELSLILTIKINHYNDFIRYILLIESIIKSAAIIQQLRQIQHNLQIDSPSSTLTKEIFLLNKNVNFNTKYNTIFELYYHDQPRINLFLVTSESLFSHHTYIADLQYIICLAKKGMLYTTDIARYELPATYYCYTKKFNMQLLEFLETIINDTYDEYNKKLYTKYHSTPISEEAFSSIVTSLAFRLQLAAQFIQYFYSTQELIEENNLDQKNIDLDHYFLTFVGNVRSKTLFAD
jgi:hypothetical protein